MNRVEAAARADWTLAVEKDRTLGGHYSHVRSLCCGAQEFEQKGPDSGARPVICDLMRPIVEKHLWIIFVCDWTLERGVSG
jgi:hypothetical protein